MNLLLLGRGKTGSLVAEVAAERKHHIQIAGAKENAASAALTPDRLRDIDTVIDFTTPHCVLTNMATPSLARSRARNVNSQAIENGGLVMIHSGLMIGASWRKSTGAVP